jgi:RNA 3'-terminal phosphate cyclase (ATP)
MGVPQMIEIDGSLGEGGGQVIRSTLALAALRGMPVRIANIRAGRKQSGLKRQHLTAVQAIATICDAKVTGADLGSCELTFEPQSIQAGEYRFQIGTAGSTSLVAQTILPALMSAKSRSKVIIEGGTHNPWCPPFEFLAKSYLPQVAKMGPQVTATLEAYGFFPAGGGRIQLTIEPSRAWKGMSLIELGVTPKPKVTAIVSNLSREIAERECKTIERLSNWSSDLFHIIEVDHPIGPGNVVMIELASKHVTEVIISIGSPNLPAERVAKQALKAARSYLKCDVPVGEYLADQLILPMAIAASRGERSSFRTVHLSSHSTTHIELVKRLLEIDISVTQEPTGEVVVQIG